MSKNSKKRRHSNHMKGALPSEDLLHTQPRQQAARKPFKPMTARQGEYANKIEASTIVFCEGPMGTGKTFVAACKAAEALAEGRIKKLIITRPAVNAGEDYGYLPGDMLDEQGGKFAPYFAPVRAILEERLGAGAVEMFLKNGKIEIAPLGHLRGHTFNDAWVLFDEAQNSTPPQMKMFLTRIGKNCKVIVDGDPAEQQDISGRSGMADAMFKLRGIDGISYVTFDVDDIVRSGISRDILIAYRNAEANDNEQEGQTVGHEELRSFLGDRSN